MRRENGNLTKMFHCAPSQKKRLRVGELKSHIRVSDMTGFPGKKFAAMPLKKFTEAAWKAEKFPFGSVTFDQ